MRTSRSADPASRSARAREIKNLNSFRFLRTRHRLRSAAPDRSARERRQDRRSRRASSIPWPARRGSCAQRKKAHDYRYFPVPSTPMATFPSAFEASTIRSVCDARAPPGSGILNSGMATTMLSPDRAGDWDPSSAAVTSGGKPGAADSQLPARDIAEAPAFQCSSRWVRKQAHSPGPPVGLRIRFMLVCRRIIPNLKHQNLDSIPGHP